MAWSETESDLKNAGNVLEMSWKTRKKYGFGTWVPEYLSDGTISATFQRGKCDDEPNGSALALWTKQQNDN